MAFVFNMSMITWGMKTKTAKNVPPKRANPFFINYDWGDGNVCWFKLLKGLSLVQDLSWSYPG